jgi:DNA primase
MKYNIGYCIAGEFNDRIIIPSYDQNNQLNFYVARAFNRSYAKYKNPEVSKDIIVFENLINWNQPIIICEGVFDAMAIRRNAVPILGKNISKSLLKKIVTSKVKEIYIALDRDALKKAVKFCEQFISMGKKVYLVDMEEKDPSEMGFQSFTNHIQEAEELDLSSLLQYKLNLL